MRCAVANGEHCYGHCTTVKRTYTNTYIAFKHTKVQYHKFQLCKSPRSARITFVSVFTLCIFLTIFTQFSFNIIFSMRFFILLFFFCFLLNIFRLFDNYSLLVSFRSFLFIFITDIYCTLLFMFILHYRSTISYN